MSEKATKKMFEWLKDDAFQENGEFHLKMFSDTIDKINSVVICALVDATLCAELKIEYDVDQDAWIFSMPKNGEWEIVCIINAGIFGKE